jgi:ABC-2 type transport system permease protein
VLAPAVDATADDSLSPGELARREVRRGKYAAAVIVPNGWGESFASLVMQPSPIGLVYDGANPLARPTVGGLLQASALECLRDAFVTVEQRQAINNALAAGRGQPPGASGAESATDPAFGLVRVEAQAARSDHVGNQQPGSMVAYYAAGIGVMFVLFSMSAAAAALLDEVDTGTLERLLGARVGMGRLLFSKWIFYAAIGAAQVVVMFVWGELVFGMGLWSPNHLAGFALMTLFTTAAASAFGILMATLCRTRAQLQGLSTTIILIMSALGGSMIPRFVMPRFVQTTSVFTFNGWAMDGYLKVFWNDDPTATLAGSLRDLAPQVAMLALLTIFFLAAARVMARRWEAA